MFTIRTILHPTDFSEQAQAAFRTACELASQHGAEVVVLHVIPLAVTWEVTEAPWPVDEEEVLEQYLRPMRSPVPGVKVRHQVERGVPDELIVSVAQDLGCDLIVMGTHGRTGLSRLFMGSVAEHVLRSAPCPVLTVRTPAGAKKAEAGRAGQAG